MTRNRFIIIVTIFIILAMLALLQLQAQQSKPPVKVAVENESETMKSAVMGLYASYQECLENPPSEADGQVASYCQANNNYVSSHFVSNLEKGGVAKAGADPITCAQNTLQSIKVGTINPAQKTAEVIEHFGGSIDVKIKVSLVKEADIWKVDNITCPLP